MKINIRIKLYKYKTLANGSHPIVIWLSRGKERRHYSTGFSVRLNDWDDKEKCVRSKHPLANKINRELSRIRSEYENANLQLQKFSEGEYSLESLHHSVYEEVGVKNVISYFDEVTSRLRNSGKVGNAKAYAETGKVFSGFLKEKDIRFSELTPSRLEKFKEYLNSRGVNDVTKHYYFRQLRALYNRAIVDGFALAKEYPFQKFKLSQFNTATPKRALKKSEIMKLFKETKRNDLDAISRLAFDYFQFSYYTGGINFVDFSQLKWQDISQSHVTYKRSKTGQLITFPTSRIADIIDYYKAFQGRDEVFVFPILDHNFHNTPIRVQYRIHKIRALVNKALKSIGNEVGISGLTTYVARHTAASVMRDEGVPISAISKTLGHTNLATTEIYLSELGQEEIDTALSKL